MPEGHLDRIEEAESERAVQKAAEKRKKEMKDARWDVIWQAFRNACEEAAVRGERVRWPVFLARNKHLAPPSYQLNAAESIAADFDRPAAPDLIFADD